MPATSSDVCNVHILQAPHLAGPCCIGGAAIAQLAIVIDAPGQHPAFPVCMQRLSCAAVQLSSTSREAGQATRVDCLCQRELIKLCTASGSVLRTYSVSAKL